MIARFGFAQVTAARTAGGFLRLVREHAVRLVLGVLLAATAVWLVDAMLGGRLGIPEPSWGSVWNVLGALLVLCLLLVAMQARGRLVVGDFSREGEDGAETKVIGLAALLVAELYRFAELHSAQARRGLSRALSEGLKSTDVQSIPATIRADVQGDMTQAVSGDSSISLGPAKLPLGALLGILGRLLRGRYLAGSLHVEGARATLTAHLQGSESRSWTITRSIPEEEGAVVPVGEMARELAGRIHTDLGWAPAQSWEASKAFTEGLAAYSRSLDATDDRRHWLRRAEQRFIEASARDPEFGLAYYNLGIVYRALEREPAADHAFVKALQVSPSQIDAYYARAEPKDPRKNTREVIWLCERVLAGDPDKLLAAQANNLRGLAERFLDEPGALDAALSSRTKAVRHARRALVTAYLRQPEWVDVYRSVLALCSINLGVAWAFKAKESQTGLKQRLFYGRGEAHLNHARRLTPADHNTHLEYGKIRWSRTRDDKAVRALRIAAEIAIGDAAAWSHLASALAARDVPDETEAVCREVTRFLGELPDEQLQPEQYERYIQICDRTSAALGEIGSDYEAERVAALPDFGRQLLEKSNAEDAEQQLTDWLQNGDLAGPWERASVHISLSLVSSAAEPGSEPATEQLRQAIALLSVENMEEVRRLGLLAQLANHQLGAGRLDQALLAAEQALELDPLSYYEASVLANVLEQLNDVARAQTMWRRALVDSPKAGAAHWRLGALALRRATTCRDRDRALVMLRDAVKEVELGLDLLDPADGATRAAAHRTLGEVRSILGEHDAAIASLEIAHALQPNQLSLLADLGDEYLNVDDYDTAERWFRAVVSNASGPDGAPTDWDEALEENSELTRGALIARGYLGLAAAQHSRGVGLDEALRLARRAKDCVKRLQLSPEQERQLQAVVALVQGAVLLELRRTEQAVRSLERSLQLTSTPDAYRYLAEARVVSAQEATDDKAARDHIRRARLALGRCERGDTFGQLTEDIEQIRSELKTLERDTAQPAEAVTA